MEETALENCVEIPKETSESYKAVYARAEVCRFNIYMFGVLLKASDPAKKYSEAALGDDTAREMRLLKTRLVFFKDKPYEPKNLVPVALFQRIQQILWAHALNK